MNVIDWLNIDRIWVIIIDIILLLMVIFPIAVIVLENRNPVKTLAWVMVLILLPFIGIILYFYFGRNYRKIKFLTKKETSDLESSGYFNTLISVDIEEVIKNCSDKITSKVHLMRLLLNNSKSALTQCNDVHVFECGQDTFQSIFETIENAVHHVHIEFYIIEDDRIGNSLKALLIKKAQQGIEVRLIYDDIGSWSLSKRFIQELQHGNVQVYSFMPVKTYRFANKINYRNHRKIIVVDGKIGFVGGINIADRYNRDVNDPLYWRDTHMRIEGDSVKSLQSVFLNDWYFISSQLFDNQKYFPEHKIENQLLVQITTSGPDSDYASIMQTYFSAIATATESVYISMPYFLPNESILTAIKTAVLSGVDVRMIMPENIEALLANWGSRSYIEELLESGVKIYFYKKGYTHSKLLIVDGVLASVGTANMDIRSFDQNFEVNALIYNERIAETIISSFLNDLKNSEEIFYNEFIKRPFSHKLKESIARLFSPLL